MRQKDWKYWRSVLIAYTLLFLLILLGSSCKTTSKIVEKEEKGSTEIVVSGTTKDSVNVIKQLIVDTDTSSVVSVWQAVIYDTSRIDSITKEHPISMTINGRTEKTNAHKTVSESADSTKVTVHDTLYVEKRDTLFIESKKEVKRDSTTSFNIFSFLISIGSILLIFAAGYYVIKKIL